MKLTPKQYVALQNAQAQVMQAEANLRATYELLGLTMGKPYVLDPDEPVILVSEVDVQVNNVEAETIR